MGLLLGPIAIATPYAIAWLARTRGADIVTLGVVAFFLVVRIQAYYQVPRSRARAREVDWWVFNLSLYLPLILFTARGDVRVGAIVYPIALATCLVAVSGYVVWQLMLWWAGAGINRGKLLYVLAVVPLHLAAFTVPMLAALGPGTALFAAACVGVMMQHYYPEAAGDRAPQDSGARRTARVR